MSASPIARDQWTRLGFLLAAIGSAVGIGNIWRFPYMVGINGGGAFLIPYFVGVVIFSLPLMILEMDTGRHLKGSVMTVIRHVNKKYRWVGALPVVISLGVLSYYLVVTGWSFAYFLLSFQGYMLFEDFSSGILPLLAFVVSLGITGAVVWKGVKAGIERMSLILMPAFAGLLTLLAFYSLSLPGAQEGLAFYLTPDFAALGNLNIWVLGIVQAFFSLAVGYGILLTYASYLGESPKGTGFRIGRYALGIAGADTLIALVGGLIVFPIVFTFGISPDLGPALTFVSLPAVFQGMAAGAFIGAGFFLLLFIAGLTSAVSYMEVAASSLVDEFRWSRRKAVTFLLIPVGLAGAVTSFTYFGSGLNVFGTPLLEFLDISLGKLLLLSAALTTIVITRSYHPEVFRSRHGRIVFMGIKHLVPFILIVIFVFQLFL